MGSKTSRPVDPPAVEPLPPTTAERSMDALVHGCHSLELGQVKLNHDCHKDFTKPMCARCPIVLFVLFRVGVAGYAFVFLIYHLTREITGRIGAKTFIYLETWTYTAITLYLLLSFVNVVIDIYQEYKSFTLDVSTGHTPWRLRLQWLFFNISLSSSCVGAVTFWVWVIVTGISPTTRAYEIINLHGMWVIIAFLEVGVVTFPLRFEHIVYPLSFGLIYLIFALIYWGAGGTDPYGNHYIYIFLDFGKHPVRVIFVVAGEITGTFLIHGSFALFFLYREKFFAKCCPIDKEPDGEELETLTTTKYGTSTNEHNK
ncbi:protein rolling stone-like [Strongylocentrotus purpuratus]|uniref:Protein rolling stone n=1 Tax=Strongylocentrotus purpuratus TaxID=7668 RepID=A0A7M7P9A9_STRPU|nr:protein rolling stone-like [Strongylocentrotus purpuratus]